MPWIGAWRRFEIPELQIQFSDLLVDDVFIPLPPPAYKNAQAMKWLGGVDSDEVVSIIEIAAAVAVQGEMTVSMYTVKMCCRYLSEKIVIEIRDFSSVRRHGEL